MGGAGGDGTRAIAQLCAGGYYIPAQARQKRTFQGALPGAPRPHAPRELPAVFWHAATRGTGTCAYFLFMRSDTYAPRDASQGDPG